MKSDLGKASRALNGIGRISLHQGRIEFARGYFVEALEIHREIADRRLVAVSLERIASVDSTAGHHARAARLWGFAERLRDTLGMPLQPAERSTQDELVANSRTSMGKERFEATWSEGRDMTMETAIELALADIEKRVDAINAIPGAIGDNGRL